MPDLSHLTPEEVYQKYKNKEIKKSVAIALLREKIFNSKKKDDFKIIFDLLELFDLNPDQHYYLLSFLTSHSKDEYVKEKAYRIIIRDYFEMCKGSLKYSAMIEPNFRILHAIYSELSKKKTRDAQKLMDILERRFSDIS